MATHQKHRKSDKPKRSTVGSSRPGSEAVADKRPSQIPASSSNRESMDHDINAPSLDSTLSTPSMYAVRKSSVMIRGSMANTEELKKEEKRARLKEARNIRFSTGESKYRIEKEPETPTTNPVSSSEVSDDFPEDESSILSYKNVQVEKEETVETTVHDTMTEEDDIEALLFYEEDEENDEMEESEREPPKGGDAIKAKTDFLQSFEIPSLSDISEEHEIEPSSDVHVTVDEALEAQKKLDKAGQFIDPLAQVPSSDNVASSEVPPSAEVAASSAGAAGGSSVDSSSSTLGIEFDDDIDGMVKFSEFNQIMVIPKPQEVDDMQTFVKFQQSFEGEDATADNTEELMAIRLKREIIQITVDFLFELINSVVTDAEHTTERDFLKNKLDSLKLHTKLKSLRDDFLYEFELNLYLNNKMCDYYKRVKNFRAFAKLSTEDNEKERNRYRENLEQLDHVTEKSCETKKKNAYLMSSVLMDLTYIQNIAQYTEEHLEEVMLETLALNKSEFLRRLTDRELRLIGQKRNEISDTRLYLITRKHTLGRITDRIRTLEQINEELCMDDFISIQNQVVALDKKIEERNNELKKLRYNYHMELHLTQHNREKAFALVSKLQVHQANLERAHEIQRTLRERLYKAKLERGRMRKQYSDLSFQGGLLSMPALMYDYDTTVDRVKTKQDNVRELKEIFKRVNLRISELESRCT